MSNQRVTLTCAVCAVIVCVVHPPVPPVPVFCATHSPRSNGTSRYTDDAHSFDTDDDATYFVRQFRENVPSRIPGRAFELSIDTAVSATTPLAHEAAIWGPNRNVLELDLTTARGMHAALGRLIATLEQLEMP